MSDEIYFPSAKDFMEYAQIMNLVDSQGSFVLLTLVASRLKVLQSTGKIHSHEQVIAKIQEATLLAHKAILKCTEEEVCTQQKS